MNSTEIFRKIKFDGKKRNLIVNAPQEYIELLNEYSFDNQYSTQEKNAYDFVQIFAVSLDELRQLVTLVANAGKYDCMFWICYPKGGGKIKSDIKRDMAWEVFALAGLRPVAQIAIDDTWSALRGRPAELVGK